MAHGNQRDAVKGELDPEAVAAGPRVGYQGGEASYSHQAASRFFPTASSLKGYESFRALLEAVQDGAMDRAVLPLENTTAGSIDESYDLLAEMDLHLVGEVIQPVEHCLVGYRRASPQTLRVVLSHPQALLQCSDYLRRLPAATAVAYHDTALAVRKVREDGDEGQAAIASEAAARLHGLPVIATNVSNQRRNYTRMVVVSRTAAPPRPGEAGKTSLVLVTRHEPGALARCLSTLAERSLNLTKLESRPLPDTPWQYRFYLDFEGNVADAATARAIEALAPLTTQLRLLGSYPPASHPDGD